MTMYPIIFAGGSGTRLWPVSRKDTPKQMQALIGSRTLLQQSYARIAKKFLKKNIHIATLSERSADIKKQLPAFPHGNMSLEPERRETAAAFLLAVAKIYEKDPQSVFMNVWSDAYIKNEKSYFAHLDTLQKTVATYPEHLVTIGIAPRYPETGYGYIKMGKKIGKIGREDIFTVEKFKEKPTLTVAKKYVASGKYLWNPMMLAGRSVTLFQVYRKYMPEMYTMFAKHIFPCLNTKKEKKALAKWYPKLEKIAIDFAIMEKADNLLTLSADFGWVDVGNWRSVKDALDTGEADNVFQGDVTALNTRDTLAYTYVQGKVVALIGLDGYIVVDTKDALLVAKKEDAQEVKRIVEYLEKKGKDGYL